MSNIYIREAIVPLEEVLPYVAVGVLPSPMGCDYTHTGKPYRVYYEQKVYLNSLRYQTFVTSGIRCVACGLEGQYFALERCLSRQVPSTISSKYVWVARWPGDPFHQGSHQAEEQGR